MAPEVSSDALVDSATSDQAYLEKLMSAIQLSSSSSSPSSYSSRSSRYTSCRYFPDISRASGETHNYSSMLEALHELRRLTKGSALHRSLIADMGFIPCLVDVLHFTMESTNSSLSSSSSSSFSSSSSSSFSSVSSSSSSDMLSAMMTDVVTTLFNLTLRNEHNKALIVAAGGLAAIVHVLVFASSMQQEARENAAAALFSLSCSESLRAFIAQHAGADAELLCGLVRILRKGSFRGRKDAAAAIYNLCYTKPNRVRAVRAGVVESLLYLLKENPPNLVNESLTIISCLISHSEGRSAFKAASGVRILLDLIASEDYQNITNNNNIIEYALSVLSTLVEHDCRFTDEVKTCGVRDLVTTLSISGSDRAKHKAVKILRAIT